MRVKKLKVLENGPNRDVLSPESDKLPAVYCSNILSLKSEKR